MRPILLQSQDSRLHLHRQLITVAVRPPCAVGDSLQATLLVTVKDLVTGLTGNIEFSAQEGHRLSLQQSGNKANALVHNRPVLPWHPRSPPLGKRGKV